MPLLWGNDLAYPCFNFLDQLQQIFEAHSRPGCCSGRCSWCIHRPRLRLGGVPRQPRVAGLGSKPGCPNEQRQLRVARIGCPDPEFVPEPVSGHLWRWVGTGLTPPTLGKCRKAWAVASAVLVMKRLVCYCATTTAQSVKRSVFSAICYSTSSLSTTDSLIVIYRRLLCWWM